MILLPDSLNSTEKYKITVIFTLFLKNRDRNLMKYLLVFSLFVLSISLSLSAQDQSHDSRTDYKKLYKSVIDEYGFDQVLDNGFLYKEKYLKKIGHQFLLQDQFYNGTLVFRGEVYKGVELKYDIYDQQLVLIIKNNNSIELIVPHNDFISAFSLGDKFFSKYNFQGESRFYQVVYDTEKVKCLYYWFKQEYDSNNIIYLGFNEFTDSEKESYLIMDGSLKKYKNNRSFTKLFPNEIKARVRGYIRINYINVAKSSDEKIKELLTYCNSLL
jgi:hypothetical protein